MNHLCDDQKWKDKMCQLYKFTWQYEMGTLLELNVPVLKWGKELKKKKKWRDKFFVCVRARTCVFYNLKVPHVVSWIYILMVNFIFSYAHFLLLPHFTSTSVVLYNEPWILCHWSIQAQFEMHLAQTKE